MNQELGLRILSQLMKWPDERARQEFAWLRLMARLKYDDYRDFLAGVRFIESLATWLQQFESEERETAYSFVRNDLVYVGSAEMQRLVESFYPRTVQNSLLLMIASQLNIPKYRIWVDKKAANELSRLKRKTLFMGLSDGARIDILRHANAGVLTNEQIVVATQLDPEKWKDLIKDLRKEIHDTSARFSIVYLIDDFMATGTTFLRFDKEKNAWVGKLPRFKESVAMAKDRNGSSPFEDNWVLCVHHYIAGHEASQAVQKRLKEWQRSLNKKDGFQDIRTSFGMVLPEDLPIKNDLHKFGPFIELSKKYYDPIIQSPHTDVGGVTHMGLGYAGCALPLVLEHNTPNNSVALLWAETGGGKRDGNIIAPAMRPLFRRRQRHYY